MDTSGPAPQYRPMIHDQPTQRTPIRPTGWQTLPRPIVLIATAGIVGGTTFVAWLLHSLVPIPSIDLLYLVAVLLVSARFGFWAGIAASILAFLAVNFFFVEPLYTLSVTNAADVVALLALLTAGATTGFLAGRLKEEADAARSRARTLERLASYANDLTSAKTTDEIETAILNHLASIGDGSALVLAPGASGLEPKRSIPPALRLEAADIQAAERVARRGVDSEPDAPGWAGSEFAFRSLGNGQGVVGYSRGNADLMRLTEDESIRRTIVHQGKLALEAIRLERKAERARSQAEREALRAALLSSLSHDLKTPLATILGGVTSLRELGDAMSPTARADLLQAIEEETGRLSHYVSNLLQMTRLQTGLDLRLEWIDVVDAAHGAVERARRGFPNRTILLSAPKEHPLILADAVLLEQALFNILDNALKFSQVDKPVQVDIATERELALVQIHDSGPGMSTAEQAEAFEPFMRGAAPIGNRSGNVGGGGLGLAIARGIVQALEGTISIVSPRGDIGTGSTLRILLPRSRNSPS